MNLVCTGKRNAVHHEGAPQTSKGLYGEPQGDYRGGDVRGRGVDPSCVSPRLAIDSHTRKQMCKQGQIQQRMHHSRRTAGRAWGVWRARAP